jgi:predicted dehydrogenase
MKDLRVGLIGCGFMGRTHSNAHRRLNNFALISLSRPNVPLSCSDIGVTQFAAYNEAMRPLQLP